MTTEILLIRSIPLERDARSTKMVAEYRRRNMHVTALVWSRGDPPSGAPDTVTCTARGSYGRGLFGMGARLAFLWFIIVYMSRHRDKFDVVHVVDLDAAIVAVPAARILGKTVFYDAFDHVSAMAGQGWIGRFLASVERSLIGRAAIAIFPDPIRLEQYGLAPSEKIRIIGNIPDLAAVPAGSTTQTNGPLLMVYIGTLEARHRGLEYLPAVCSALGADIKVVVGGIGELHNYFEDASSRLPNLSYIGQQDYDAALRQMANADCLYGPYLLTTPAHRFASPNKMYEHLALGKPLITNTGTPPAQLVEKAGSGFLFDGSIEDLLRLLRAVDRKECMRVGRQAKMAWTREFAGLREQQLESFFTKMCEVLEPTCSVSEEGAVVTSLEEPICGATRSADRP